jgi:hypothetical protein
MASAAEAAFSPLCSTLLASSRAQACASFSTVRMPLPIARRCEIESSISPRADSLETIS